MLGPGNRTGGVSGVADRETALGWQRRTGPQLPGSRDRHDGPRTRRRKPAPPAHFHRSISRPRGSWGYSGAAGRLLDIEPVRGRDPRDSRAQLSRGGVKRPGELHDRAQPRLAPGPLEQRDLGPVQVAAIAQLFLGDARGGAGLAKVGGEPLLRTQVTNSLKLKTKTLQTRCFTANALPGTSATFQFETFPR